MNQIKVLMGLISYILSSSSIKKYTIRAKTARQVENGPVELTMWVHQLFSSEGQFYQKRIDQFNGVYKDKIHVTLVGIPRPGYEKEVEAAIYSNQLPDIIAVDGPDVARFVELGAIIPVDEYVDDEFLSDFLPSIIEQGTYKDKLYHLGVYESSVVLYYNKLMLKQAGIRVPTRIEEAWTWDELLENAKILTKPRVYGLNMYYDYSETEWFPYAFLPLVWSNEGDIVAPDGFTVQGYLNGPKTVEVFDFIGKVFKEGVANTSLKNTDFQNARAAMMFQGPWLVAELKENHPTLEWGMIPYPVSPNTQKQVTPSGSWGFSITSNSKNPKEAFEVIKWMTNQQSNRELYEVIKMPPSRESVLNEIPEFEQSPEKIIADQLTTTARSRPKTPIYPILSQSFADAFKAVASGQDAQQALDEAVKNVEAEVK